MRFYPQLKNFCFLYSPIHMHHIRDLDSSASLSSSRYSANELGQVAMYFYDTQTFADPVVDFQFRRAGHCAAAGYDELTDTRYFLVAGGFSASSGGYRGVCCLQSLI